MDFNTWAKTFNVSSNYIKKSQYNNLNEQYNFSKKKKKNTILFILNKLLFW